MIIYSLVAAALPWVDLLVALNPLIFALDGAARRFIPAIEHAALVMTRFAEASFANVYSNSLDHCLYLDKLASGVRRVLRPKGRFYVMATNRPEMHLEDWLAKGGNEGLYWQTSDDLRDAICGLGFVTKQQWRDGKWGHYILANR